MLRNEIQNIINQEITMNSLMMNYINNLMNMNNMINRKNIVENPPMKKEIMINVIDSRNREKEVKYTFLCPIDEKVSYIIEKYKSQVENYEERSKFYFNAHILNPSSTISEVGLQNDSKIFVYSNRGVLGG